MEETVKRLVKDRTNLALASGMLAFENVVIILILTGLYFYSNMPHSYRTQYACQEDLTLNILCIVLFKTLECKEMECKETSNMPFAEQNR